MSKAVITESYLSDIASAIRYKNGSSDTYLPSEMALAIRSISGGENDNSWIVGDGKTYLHMKIEELGRTTVHLHIIANSSGSINWGDGSSVVSISSSYRAQEFVHAYERTGSFVITISGTSLELGDSFGNIFGYPDIDEFIVSSNMLKRVEIGNGIIALSPYCFADCMSLSDVAFSGNQLVNIGYEAFRNCYSLTYIELPSTITTIESGMFQNCYGLNSVRIPFSVTEIQQSVFENCYSLQNVNLTWSLTDLGDQAFLNCKSLQSISIPSDITELSFGLLEECSGLTVITIGSDVTTINENAFKNCTGVKEYHFTSSTPPTLIGTNVFLGIPSDCIIYVPEDHLDEYQSATNWSTYASYMQEEEIMILA